MVTPAWDSQLSLPPPAPVVDEVGLLSREEQQSLDRLLRNIKTQSGVEISVYVASSLRERAIEEFSLAVAEQWKLGRKKEDKALLFVLAPKEKRMRLEVGYGIEGDITDAFSRRVLDNVARPYFQQGRYAEGILAALGALQEKIPLGLAEEEVPRQRQGLKLSPFLVFVLIVLFIIFSIIGRLMGFSGHHRRGGFGGYGGWGGGGGFGGSIGGGSSWGGGGGGFGGGGASSNW